MLSLVAAMGLVLAFQAPYHFPPAVRTISASYDYGFNNTFGILILGVFALMFLWAGFLWCHEGSLPRFFTDKSVEPTIGFRDIWLAAVPSLLVISAVFLLSTNFGFGESTQFILTMQRIASGQKIYTDFDFYYGPLLAYLPYGVYKLMHFVRGDYKDAYFFTLTVLQLVGLLELGYLLNALNIPPRARRWMFYAIALSTLPVHSGINLIVFRYITPLIGFVFLKRIEKFSLGLAVAIPTLCFVTFGISVEYGTVFILATAIYYAGRFLIDRSVSSLRSLALVIVSSLLVYLTFPGLFHTVRLYLMGAWRWPFVPSLVLVLFFLLVFTLAFAIGARLRNIKENHFFLCFCLLCFGSLPAALGRCDPGHVLLNGMGIIVLAYAYLHSVVRPRLITIFRLVFVIAFGVLMNLSTLAMYSNIYKGLAFRQLNERLSGKQLSTLEHIGSRVTRIDEADMRRRIDSFTQAQNLDLKPAFVGIDHIAAPYFTSLEISSYLQSSGKLNYLYFKDFNTLASELEVAWAIRDLKEKNCGFLILPEDWLTVAEPVDQSHIINLIFSSKYTRQPIHNGREILEPLVAYISAQYVPYRHVGKFIIVKRL
jgi:hypothetical protein